jgi:hypothetical protein
MINVNTHIHTPYCFSSFESISHVLALARKQNISVLGINDFNTTEGYEEFATACEQAGVYPLFNIELVSINQEDHENGFHWNDPVNPGVIYLCGKGLNYPLKLSSDSRNLISTMWKITQDRIWKMVEQLNRLLSERNIDLSLDYNQIRNTYAKNSVREHHLAKCLYSAIVHKWPEPQDQITAFRNLFDDPQFTTDLSHSFFLQDQIRERLFDFGKAAYIDENFTSFYSTHQVRSLILEAGGIPSFPIFDFNLNGISDIEEKMTYIARKLHELGIFAVEFLCSNTSLELLKKCADFFYRQDFCVTFGTSHNTMVLSTLVPSAQNNTPFDSELQQIAYEGACIIAAHQEKHRACLPGFLNEEGYRNFYGTRLKEFIFIGDGAIRKVISGGASLLNQN